MSLTKHGGPQLHELRLVKTAVLVLVKHFDEVPRHAVIEAHPLLYHRYDLLRTQDAVAVFVQFFETRRHVFVPNCNIHPI